MSSHRRYARLLFVIYKERNGYMPPTKDPDSLNKLKMVFASMPATLTPEYAKTEQYIRQLKVTREGWSVSLYLVWFC